MSSAATGALVAAASARRTGVAAFNVITLEHAEAIVAGAEQLGRGVIVQISQNAVRFHGGRLQPIAAACFALAREASVPVALHLDHVELDHVESPALLASAAACGLSSVMVDGGALPYDRNVALTAAAVGRAHADGLWVEAELGFVGGKPGDSLGAHAAGARTDPDQARRFVEQTGVDALAVAVGSSHAMTSRSATLDLNLVAALAAAVPVPLVLHGSSGVPDDQLRRVVAAGLVKINIGTALNVAMTTAVREQLGADPGADRVDPRRYLDAGRTAMASVVAELLGVVSGPR